jgi:phosphatidylethanolamine-binding protein (PEBP) family uncharacterized protein
MEIEYPNKIVVRDGMYISPKNSSAVPTIVFMGEKQKLYTLIMLDPDAVGGTRIHWLVVNISDHNATVIFPYNGPHPPQGTGNHHYYFALLEQENKVPIPRPKFTNRYENIHTVFRKLGLWCGCKILDTKYFVSAAQKLQ